MSRETRSESPAKSEKNDGVSRVEGFARFFKRYIGLSSVLAAALPIPVASFQLIPAYSHQIKFLGVYTPLFCFLMLSFVFYSRHSIARAMFVRRPTGYGVARTAAILPLLLVIACLSFVIGYHITLDGSVRDRQDSLGRAGYIKDEAAVLKETENPDIPQAAGLVVCYLGIFLSAEAAFILMALREYLQDSLKIPETELLRLPKLK